MKKVTTLLFLWAFVFAQFIYAQTTNRSVKINGYTLRYNEAAAKNINFKVDILDENGNDLCTCKDARVAIVQLTTYCQCFLTTNQKAAIYYVAHEPIPMDFMRGIVRRL